MNKFNRSYIFLLFVFSLCFSLINKAQDYNDYNSDESFSENSTEEYNSQQIIENINIEEIADCLANKGVILYGSPNCGRTQSQISVFEGYFPIEFVNCKNKANRFECSEQGVGPFPHWVFPDGNAIGGEILYPEELAEIAGCYGKISESLQ